MDNVRLYPSTGGLTDRSGTITAGGTSQQVAAANADRRYLLLQNPSNAAGSLWVNFGVAAVQSQPSVELAPGSTLIFEGSFAPNAAIHVIGLTTGMAFTAKEG